MDARPSSDILTAVLPRICALTIAAPTLEEGVRWAVRTFGVLPINGGRHKGLNTHNALFLLDDQSYVEIIAIDPTSAGGTLFDGLPWVQKRLDQGLCVLTWSVVVESLADEPDAVLMQRGEATWRLTNPAGCCLPGMGIPGLMQWLTNPPWQTLKPSGVRLESLHVGTPHAPILIRQLQHLGFQDTRVGIHLSPTPALRAVFDTPAGRVVLE